MPKKSILAQKNNRVNFIKKYIEKQRKKSLWAWIGDILFTALIIGLLIPSTRTPIMVFMKRITMYSPSVSVDDNYGQLHENDFLWQLKNSNGKVLPLKSLNNKPIFLNFWATWCPPCIAEMPAIDLLEQEYGDRVNFVLVSNESLETTKRFLRKKGLNVHTYQFLSEAPKILSSNSIPITFIINKKGKIVVKKTGSSKWNGDSVKKLLDELIAE